MMEDNGLIKTDESKANLTIFDSYIPTVGETKVLQAMLNPENAGLSVTDLCKAAQTSRDTFYNAMKKPEFVNLYRNTALDVIKTEIYPLVKVGIREAKRGSFQHWKVLMEMTGMHTEKQEINVSFEQLLKKALESGE
jgi:hypothetical protein